MFIKKNHVNDSGILPHNTTYTKYHIHGDQFVKTKLN